MTRRLYSIILALVIQTAFGLILLACAFINLRALRLAEEDRLYSDAGRIASRAALILAIPVFYDDYPAVRQVIMSEFDDSRVSGMAVFKGDALIEGQKRDLNWDTEPWDDLVPEDSIEGDKSVMMEDKEIGRIVVYVSTRIVEEGLAVAKQRETWRFTGLFIFMALVQMLALRKKRPVEERSSQPPQIQIRYILPEREVFTLPAPIPAALGLPEPQNMPEQAVAPEPECIIVEYPYEESEPDDPEPYEPEEEFQEISEIEGWPEPDESCYCDEECDNSHEVFDEPEEDVTEDAEQDEPQPDESELCAIYGDDYGLSELEGGPEPDESWNCVEDQKESAPEDDSPEEDVFATLLAVCESLGSGYEIENEPDDQAEPDEPQPDESELCAIYGDDYSLTELEGGPEPDDSWHCDEDQEKTTQEDTASQIEDAEFAALLEAYKSEETIYAALLATRQSVESIREVKNELDDQAEQDEPQPDESELCAIYDEDYGLSELEGGPEPDESWFFDDEPEDEEQQSEDPDKTKDSEISGDDAAIIEQQAQNNLEHIDLQLEMPKPTAPAYMLGALARTRPLRIDPSEDFLKACQYAPLNLVVLAADENFAALGELAEDLAARAIYFGYKDLYNKFNLLADATGNNHGAVARMAEETALALSKVLRKLAI